MNLIKYLTLFFACICLSIPSAAQEATDAIDVGEVLCPSSDLIGTKMITDVCWEGVFPLQIAGVTLFGKTRYAPGDRNTDRTCACSGDLSAGELPKVGVTTGYFAPKYLLTVTKSLTVFLS